MQVCSQTALASSKKPPCYNEYKVRQPNHYNKEESKWTIIVYHTQKYSLQETTQGKYLTGGVPPVRFSM